MGHAAERPAAGLPSHADRRPCGPRRRGAAATRRSPPWSRNRSASSRQRTSTGGACASRGSRGAATRTRSTRWRSTCPTADITTARLDAIREHFHATYEREYTYRLPAPVELVCFHLVAIAEVDKLSPQKARSHGAGGEGRGEGSAGGGLRGSRRPQRHDLQRRSPGAGDELRGTGHHRGGGHNRRHSSRDALQRSTTTATTSSRPRAKEDVYERHLRSGSPLRSSRARCRRPRMRCSPPSGTPQ